MVYQWSLGDNGTVEIRGGNSCSTATFNGGMLFPSIWGSYDVWNMVPAPDVVEDSCALQIGHCISDPVYSYIDIGDFSDTCVSDPSSCTSDGVTWSVWLKLCDKRKKRQRGITIIHSGHEEYEYSFILWYIYDDHIVCSVRDNNTELSVSVNVTAIVPISTWFQVACTFNFSKLIVEAVAVYVNGLRVPSLPVDHNTLNKFSKYRYQTGRNHLLIAPQYYYIKDISLSISNLILADGILGQDDIQNLFSCGSIDWSLRLRSLVSVPTTNNAQSIHLNCTASAITGPAIAWRVYQPKCDLWKVLHGGNDSDSLRIYNHSVSSCVLTSSLTISSYRERGYAGSVIECSASTRGTSTTKFATFTIAEVVDEPQMLLGEDATRPALQDAAVQDKGIPIEIFNNIDNKNDICGGRRIYAKEDKVITTVPLTVEEGEYQEVTAEVDGQVYVANIPGLQTAENVTLIVVVTVFKLPNNDSQLNVSSPSDQPIRFGSLVVGLDIIDIQGNVFTEFEDEPVKLTFPVLEIQDMEIPICSFRSDEDEDWLTYGCHVEGIIGNDVMCSCNHLTHFAILLQVEEVTPYTDTSLLNLITRIGLGLSIVCLSVTLFVYAFCRLTSTRIVTHANLAVALMISHITFLFIGTENPTACKAVAILLHYFLLAAFTWMALEGVFLYIKSTPTFQWKIRLPGWLLIGWGCPVGIVGTSMAVRMQSYGRAKSCWLSFDGGFVWAFLAPVLFVLIGNSVILIRLIFVFFSLRSNKKKSEAEKVKAGLRMLIVLEPLLGLPWILGLFYIDGSTIGFAYASAIVNSLQGVFVFISQCLFDKDVRQFFRSKRSRVEAINVNVESTGISTLVTATVSESVTVGRGDSVN
ncbi:adhesion G protein-coupled receptor L1-like isoform X2 [Acanthaster planci]|nr:adhesion G protein-coupled receptor L1-like isoform X2 [Acanthaster planci]